MKPLKTNQVPTIAPKKRRKNEDNKEENNEEGAASSVNQNSQGSQSFKNPNFNSQNNINFKGANITVTLPEEKPVIEEEKVEPKKVKIFIGEISRQGIVKIKFNQKL